MPILFVFRIKKLQEQALDLALNAQLDMANVSPAIRASILENAQLPPVGPGAIFDLQIMEQDPRSPIQAVSMANSRTKPRVKQTARKGSGPAVTAAASAAASSSSSSGAIASLQEAERLLEDIVGGAAAVPDVEMMDRDDAMDLVDNVLNEDDGTGNGNDQSALIDGDGDAEDYVDDEAAEPDEINDAYQQWKQAGNTDSDGYDDDDG